MNTSDSLSPDDKWRLLEQWERLRAGEADAAEAATLNDRLRSDPAARDWLARAVVLESALRFDAETLLSGKPAAAPSPTTPLTHWRGGLRWSHAAAAAVAVLLSSAVWFTLQRQPVAATLVKAQSCKWGNSALPTLEGSSLPPGTLDLVEGMATLRFESGAEVVMEAPVSLEILSPMEARVHRGTVVADVPPEAKGFTIQAPETTIVDYGTRFGVSAGDDGKCLVHVLDGLVEVNRQGDSEVKALRGGERLDYGGLTRDMVNPDAERPQSEPGRWLPAADMADLGDGWQMLTTAFGRGKDSWIQSGSHRVSGRETFLRVKHTTLSDSLERKTYLAFDLSKIQDRIEEAELVLHLEPSDLGYASLVPDAVFSVHGLTAENEDDWPEDSLSWKSAPAHSLDAAHHSLPDPARAIPLGSFTVAQGRQTGAFTLTGPALAEFLRSDSNGLVTLILCRETDELARNGLAHAFASKENSRNAPPMLRLRTVVE